MLAVSLPILWNNERKFVRIESLIYKAKKMIIEVDYREPKQQDNFKLVHASGVAVNREPVKDSDFDL